MKRLLHKLLDKVIPWPCWSWRQTTKLMRWNYWANREEFIKLLEDNAEARKNWMRS